MADQNFTNFNFKVPELGDYLVGYKADGTDEFKTTAGELLSALTYKVSDIINVKDYGAKGDGVTNDRTAIEAAFNTCSANQTVWFPGGTYLFDTSSDASPFTIATHLSGIQIYGDKAVLLCNTKNNAAFFTVQANDVTIEGLVFDGFARSGDVYTNIHPNLSVPNQRHMIRLNGQNTKIQNCVFKNSMNGAVVSRDGVGAVKSGKHKILNNLFDNCWQSIMIISTNPDANTNGLSDYVISNNTIQNNSFINILSEAARGIQIGQYSNCPDVQRVLISNNTILSGGDLNIELYGQHKSINVVGNYSEGSQMCLSVGGADDVNVSGNILRGGSYCELEIAQSSRVNVAGNLISSKYSNESYPANSNKNNINISNQGGLPCDDVTITGNTFLDATTVLFTNATSANNLLFNSNNVKCEATEAGLSNYVFNTSGTRRNWQISNNIFNIVGTEMSRVISDGGGGAFSVKIDSNTFIGQTKEQPITTVLTNTGWLDISNNNFQRFISSTAGQGIGAVGDFIINTKVYGTPVSAFNLTNNTLSATNGIKLDSTNTNLIVQNLTALNLTSSKSVVQNLTASTAFISFLSADNFFPIQTTVVEVSAVSADASAFKVTATGSLSARTLADRFAEVVNVRDFGAVGNGITNDRVAIQAAIDFCLLNKVETLVFPSGVYALSGIHPRPAVSSAIHSSQTDWTRGQLCFGDGSSTDPKDFPTLNLIGEGSVTLKCVHDQPSLEEQAAYDNKQPPYWVSPGYPDLVPNAILMIYRRFKSVKIKNITFELASSRRFLFPNTSTPSGYAGTQGIHVRRFTNSNSVDNNATYYPNDLLELDGVTFINLPSRSITMGSQFGTSFAMKGCKQVIMRNCRLLAPYGCFSNSEFGGGQLTLFGSEVENLLWENCYFDSAATSTWYLSGNQPVDGPSYGTGNNAIIKNCTFKNVSIENLIVGPNGHPKIGWFSRSDLSSCPIDWPAVGSTATWYLSNGRTEDPWTPYGVPMFDNSNLQTLSAIMMQYTHAWTAKIAGNWRILDMYNVYTTPPSGATVLVIKNIGAQIEEDGDVNPLLEGNITPPGTYTLDTPGVGWGSYAWSEPVSFIKNTSCIVQGCIFDGSPIPTAATQSISGVRLLSTQAQANPALSGVQWYSQTLSAVAPLPGSGNPIIVGATNIVFTGNYASNAYNIGGGPINSSSYMYQNYGFLTLDMSNNTFQMDPDNTSFGLGPGARVCNISNNIFAYRKQPSKYSRSQNPIQIFLQDTAHTIIKNNTFFCAQSPSLTANRLTGIINWGTNSENVLIENNSVTNFGTFYTPFQGTPNPNVLIQNNTYNNVPVPIVPNSSWIETSAVSWYANRIGTLENIGTVKNTRNIFPVNGGNGFYRVATVYNRNGLAGIQSFKLKLKTNRKTWNKADIYTGSPFYWLIGNTNTVYANISATPVMGNHEYIITTHGYGYDDTVTGLFKDIKITTLTSQLSSPIKGIRVYNGTDQGTGQFFVDVEINNNNYADPDNLLEVEIDNVSNAPIVNLGTFAAVSATDTELLDGKAAAKIKLATNESGAVTTASVLSAGKLYTSDLAAVNYYNAFKSQEQRYNFYVTGDTGGTQGSWNSNTTAPYISGYFNQQGALTSVAITSGGSGWTPNNTFTLTLIPLGYSPNRLVRSIEGEAFAVAGKTGRSVGEGVNIAVNGSWNTSHFVLGTNHLWVDSSNKLRIKSSAPTSDTDGSVVGTQS